MYVHMQHAAHKTRRTYSVLADRGRCVRARVHTYTHMKTFSATAPSMDNADGGTENLGSVAVAARQLAKIQIPLFASMDVRSSVQLSKRDDDWPGGR